MFVLDGPVTAPVALTLTSSGGRVRQVAANVAGCGRPYGPVGTTAAVTRAAGQRPAYFVAEAQAQTGTVTAGAPGYPGYVAVPSTYPATRSAGAGAVGLGGSARPGRSPRGAQ